MKKLVYICAPFRGENETVIERNIDLAVSIGRWSMEADLIPVVPHINSKAMFGLNGDNDEVTEFDDTLLSACDLILVCGAPTAGMQHEIDMAQAWGIPIKHLIEMGGEDE